MIEETLKSVPTQVNQDIMQYLEEINILPFIKYEKLQQITYVTRGINKNFNTIYIVININKESEGYKKFYIGYHSSHNLNSTRHGIVYLGSGPVIKKAILKYGFENFVRIDCEFYDTVESMKQREAEIITNEFLINYKEKCYNLISGSESQMYHIHNSPNKE